MGINVWTQALLSDAFYRQHLTFTSHVLADGASCCRSACAWVNDGGGERDEERWRAGQKQDKVYVDICEHTSRTRGAELLQHNLSGSQVIWQPVIFFWSAGARCWKQRRFRVDFSSCHTCKFLHSSSTFDLRSVCVCVCLWLAVWKCILLSTLVDLSWTWEGICRHAVSALSCIYHGESSVVAMVMRPLLAYIRFFITSVECIKRF